MGKTFSVDYNLLDYQDDVRKTIGSHVDNEQDLGVWCTADLKPSLQCQHAASKAMKVLGLIKRTFKIFSSVSLDIIQNLRMFAPIWSTVSKCGLHSWLGISVLWRWFSIGLPN